MAQQPALSPQNYRKLSLAYQWHVQQASDAHKAGDYDREQRHELKATQLAIDMLREGGQ